MWQDRISVLRQGGRGAHVSNMASTRAWTACRKTYLAGVPHRPSDAVAAWFPARPVPWRRDRARSPWRASNVARNRPVPLSGDPPANSSGSDTGRPRTRAQPADVGAASVCETRIRGKPQNPAGPIVGSAPSAAALATVEHARDRQARCTSAISAGGWSAAIW